MLKRGIPAIVRRVLSRLEQAEASVLNPHLRDDYRIAWITVLWAAREEWNQCSPHVAATYHVLRMHPDKVWPWIVAWRKAKFGSEYTAFYDENGNWRTETLACTQPPKKPVQMELRFHSHDGQRVA
jgi:hypothetical protein